jgi:NADPH:quinone reductase-like Zn-dependent oxidoreductase/SAM-dependent methyltransferase/acyl carrier protein
MHLRLEELCGEYVERALARLGWQPAPGATFDVDELRLTLRVLPRHRRLFARLVAIAEEIGLVERHATGWRVLRVPRHLDVSSSAEQLAREWEDVGELEMTVRAGEKLAEALRGEVDPHQLLFPAGSTATAERMYRDSPPARVMNGLVTSAIVPLARAATPERPLRILEIGAGTGGTTAHLLPQLPPDRVAYTFTDVGPLFVSRARERFGSYPFMRFAVFDAEREPEGQGLSPHAYDVIVATNVIHATAHLRRTLGRTQRLLAPGGVLVMVEVTEPQRWFDLTVGLTDGWWSFADTDLRPAYATLSRGQWLRLLGECGFVDALALPVDAPHIGSLSRQAVLVSRASANASARRWLIYADVGGTMRDLAQALRRRGDECVIVRAGTSYEFDGTVAVIDPLAKADVERLLSEWRAAGPDHAFHGVVHGSSLPTTAWEFVSPEALSVAHRLGVTSALHLAQALLLGSVPVSGLWLVTRGAQAVDEMEGVLDPTHATLWGFGATLALEHPELRPTCVDLGADSGGDVAALLTELDAAAADAAEPRVAYRGGRRRVARLASLRRQPRTMRAPWRLQRDEGGSLDQLRVEPLAGGGTRALGPNEVEIGVEATGLNFKDVLNALGMYPGNPGPLGGECAGRVTRVGAAVTHVRPGDRVMAVAPGSFASHVVARDTLVQAIPDHMPMEEGATFPIAYLTAAFCLEHLAGVRADDCVLVHAAAGGVGMAAVRIAQRAGARVIATAGSPWKRDVVRSLGVEHVLDSRSTTFASEVLRLTDGRGADVVLNSLSGDMVAASFRALAANGRFIEIGKRDIRGPADVAIQAPSARYHVVDWGETEVRDPALIGDMFTRLAGDLHAGRLTSLPRHVFDRDDVGQAFRFMAQARHIGRIAVRHSDADAAPVARRDGTYLVTGGLSGLGLAAARWLGEHGAGRIVLIGRRGITAETEPVLAFLRERGVTVVAAAVDVSDEAALVSLLRQLRATGAPIRGVLHSAGVLDDAAILSQDRQRFERVFAPKVTGTYLLDRHTRGDPLDWFVAFSSIAAVLGARGQANHSAANAFLDAVALERRRRGLPALSINWGPWSEIGAALDRGAAERLAERGVTALTTAQGFQALQRLMSTSGAGRAVVLPVDWKRFAATGGAMPLLHDVLRRDAESSQHDIVGTARAPASPHRTGEPSLKEQLAVTPPGRRRPTVLAFVRDRALRALGLDPSRAVDPRTPLGELGLDSLLAVELRNTLATALGQTLPATLLFDYPTIDALTDFILTDVLGLGDDTTPITAASHTLPVAAAAQLVTTVEDLSDDEVERLIASRANRK